MPPFAPPDRLTSQERGLQRLLRRSHLATDRELPTLLRTYADVVGVEDPVAYVVDLQQQVLTPFLEPVGERPHGHVEPLGVDTTLAGRAFQLTQVLTQRLAADSPATRVWLPLLDGTERLGLLAVTVPSVELLERHDGALSARLEQFAALAAELIVTKTMYGDTLVRLRRRSEMGLAAEMQWSLLPPLTFASTEISIAAGLEPAYEVAGDSIDYAVDGEVARMAIFDGMGHGLPSAQMTALAVAAYRNARRSGLRLSATVDFVDEVVASIYSGDAFITAQLAELEVPTGSLTWLNAGHPDPLLVRGGRLVHELHTPPRPPLGLGTLAEPGSTYEMGREVLEPGDLVVLYSDGVSEARSPDGEQFGTDRLVDLVVRNVAAGLPAPETTRRIIRALLHHQQAQLADDASLLIVHFRPPNQADLLP